MKTKTKTRAATWLALAMGIAAAGGTVHASSVFTILDQYTDDVPTGNNYEKLTYYDEYVDAGSEDASPFVLTRTTTANDYGILFYGSTELISGVDANTFRLTSTTGLFDFTSFNLQDLEDNDSESSLEVPRLTITSSTGQSQTWSSIRSSGSFSFEDSGVQTMDWSGVQWVDFTTQYTKARTSDFVLATEISAVPEASTSLGLLALGSAGLLTRRRLKRKA